MSDKTVDEIMGLVGGYRHSLQYESQRIQDFTVKCILEAITALAAERDQAVTRANSYQMSFEEMCEFRNDAAEERDEAQEDSLKWAAQCGSFHQERDAMKARVMELERAVGVHWWESCDEEFTCVFCQTSWSKSKDNYPHDPDCIVRTIPARE